MKAGDLVRWNYFGRNENMDGVELLGIIISDYYDGGIKPEDPWKNVYWMKDQWIRPINPIHLELLNESR